MPQILVAAASGIAVWIVSGWLKREQDRISDYLRQIREQDPGRSEHQPDDAVVLEKNPVTGIYQPKQ